ncbi:mitochondrial FAD-linked sulfhydryl oxidase ERV1 [Lophium mytilinum]|uniref:Sulfhydryl oxidase n=1 Tax=Lophium mytilinum TaxID=390894 RepID=A0A6A6QTH3_9PEZI|nr:mitochondrial FAD-linked sulfhydryl oxidase ERV1 [Lophium mytilinum]
MAASEPSLLEAQKADSRDEHTPRFSKGVELGPDGKPCRTCTSSSEWKAMFKSAKIPSKTPAVTTSPLAIADRTDCPPDIEQLGRASWTLLHSITAAYPSNPSPAKQTETRDFLSLFSKLYPCHTCASDFQTWLKEGRNAPRVSSREEFGRWMCEAHNAVNVKLGKEKFDCDRWEERWRTGWKDGGCD